MLPLATYKEDKMLYSRDFQLHEDKIHIHFKEGFNTIGDMDIPLNQISPNPSIIHTRDESNGKIILFVSIACFIVLFYVTGKYVHINNLVYVAITGLAIVLIINVISYVNPKRITFYSFPVYGASELNIGKYGKQIDKYDNFINLLIIQIHKAKAKS